MIGTPFLTVHDIAALLKVKEATVRQWIRDKDLRAIKFGREWRVAQTDFDDFVNTRANR